MTHLFDRVIDRQNTGSEKWDLRQSLYGREDVTPMWVADMDLPTPDFILDAIRQRLQHPILGYTHIPLSVAESVCAWQKRQYDCFVVPETVVWLSGVVSGLYVAIQAFTQPDDGVMVFTPVYAPFMRSVKDLGRQLVAVPMRLVAQQYELDWAQIEQKLAVVTVRLLLLSNPHNPSGRVWTRAELTRLSALCLQHNVLMVSDEVWADVSLDSHHRHIQLASLSEAVAQSTLTLNSPSKAFNCAALHTAYAIISNPNLRASFVKKQQQTRAGEASLFGLCALQAAYSDAGAEWLASMNLYLAHNVQQAAALLTQALPQLRVILPQASYLLWLDFSAYFSDQVALENWCVEQGLGLSSGVHFGADGKGFMRMNVALPTAQLTATLRQLMPENS